MNNENVHNQELLQSINKTITCSYKGQATTRSLVLHSQDRDHSRPLGSLGWLVGRGERKLAGDEEEGRRGWL